MFMLWFLIAATVAVADGQLNIFAAQFTSQLTITCELPPNVNVTRVVSLVFTKSQDGVDQPQASVNSFNTHTNHLHSGVVLGRISNDNTNSTLSLQWNENVNAGLDGTYTCTMVGLDSNDLPLARSQKFEFKLGELDPVCTATPTNIDDGLTLSLVLECSMINTQQPDNFTVYKIEIFKKTNATNQILAYANSSTAEITTRDHRWGVIGSYFYGQNSTLYLAIKLMDPTSADAGTYVCDFRTGDNGTGTSDNGTGIQKHILRSAQVTASDSTKPYISPTFEFTESLEDYYLFACNFEKGNCGLNVKTTSGDLSSTIMEDRMLGKGRNMNGHYLQTEFSNLWTGANRILSVETQLIPARIGSVCVNAWFRVDSYYFNAYALLVRQNGITSTIKSNSGYNFSSTGLNIQKAFFANAISAPFSLILEFQFDRVQYIDGSMSIDDILITNINC